MADSKGNSSTKIGNKNISKSLGTGSNKLLTGNGTGSGSSSGPIGSVSNKQNHPNPSRKEDRGQPKKYSVNQRPPSKVGRRLNDVYIGETSNFQSQYVKCQQLLDGGQKVIYLHGIGDAIPRALNLATKLKLQYLNSLDFSVTTSTVKLIGRSHSAITELPDQVCCRHKSIPDSGFTIIKIMFFTLQEIGQWLGVTAYEIWVWITSVFVFTILLSVKLDTNTDISWSVVFAPLFVGDALNAYFITTVFIRMYLDKKARPATFRTLWSLTQLFLIFLFELFLCVRLSDPKSFEFSEIMAPLFILTQLVMIRACQLH